VARETCENLFACSFLVERNDLALTLDSQGRFMAKKVVVTDNNVHETENIVRDVLKMDWEVYDRLVKEYVVLCSIAYMLKTHKRRCTPDASNRQAMTKAVCCL
jgi:hypothetical protein